MTDDRASGIRVRVRRKNLDGQYMITPNDLFRGTGIYQGLDPYERVLLGAGLSCDDGWDTTLGDIEEWLPGIGRDKHRRIRRRLRERGFLSMTRTQIPAGQTDAGKFIWTLAFLMEPLEPGQRDELPPLKAKAPKAPKGASADALEIRASESDDETAGQPMTVSPGHRSPGHRSPGPGDQGDVYKEQKNQSLEELPPYPPEDPSADVEAAAATGEGEDSRSEETTQLIDAAVAETLRLRPRWREAAVRKAVDGALDADRDPASVAWAIVKAAQDKTTSTPNRITSAGWWAVVELERHVTAPAPRDLGPRCPKPAHFAELESKCAICRSEKRDAELEAARAEAAAKAAEVAEAVPAQRPATDEAGGVSGSQAARAVALEAERRFRSRVSA